MSFRRSNSAVVSLLLGTIERGRTWVRLSWFVQLTMVVWNRCWQATVRSTTTSGAREVIHWTRQSHIVRYVFREPSIITIDLRNAVTVGPIVTRLLRLRESLERAWHTSTIRSLFTTIDRRRSHRPIRAVSAITLTAVTTNTVLALQSGSVPIGSLTLRFLVFFAALMGIRGSFFRRP